MSRRRGGLPLLGHIADGEPVDGGPGRHLHEGVDLASPRRVGEGAAHAQADLVFSQVRPDADGREIAGFEPAAAVLQEHDGPGRVARLGPGEALLEGAGQDDVAVGIDVSEYGAIAGKRHAVGVGLPGRALELAQATGQTLHGPPPGHGWPRHRCPRPRPDRSC